MKEKKKNVLFVGSLVRRKGVDSVLNILENKDVRKKYHFFFAGPDVEGYRAKLNKYGNVTVLGKIGRDELFNYYSCVDLLLFPSFSEGFGRVNAEAISVGCPVIARNIVNLDRIVDKVFESDEELLDILLQEKFRKRKKKIKLPDEIKPETIKKQHLEVIEEVQRED